MAEENTLAEFVQKNWERIIKNRLEPQNDLEFAHVIAGFVVEKIVPEYELTNQGWEHFNRAISKMKENAKALGIEREE